MAALAPDTGKVLWTHAYPVGGKPQRPEVTIAMPRLAGPQLFLSSFYQGSLLLDLAGPEPTVAWNRRSKRKSEFEDGLHTTMGTPVIRDGYLYGVCGFGELRCLDLATGDRRWETFAATEGKKSLFGQVFLIEQAGRYWLWNDQGELILAKLTPQGYRRDSVAPNSCPPSNIPADGTCSGAIRLRQPPRLHAQRPGPHLHLARRHELVAKRRARRVTLPRA